MQEELNAVLSMFENTDVRALRETPQLLHGMPVYKTEFCNRNLIFALSGVGRTNTSINATLIIDHFKPSEIINIGTAGGLLQKQKILDVVIPEDVVAVDIDLTALGFEYGSVMGAPKAYSTDDKMRAKLSLNNGLTMHGGTVGSSEAFICKPEQVAEIHRRFGENRVACVEMEAFSIAVACHRFGIPFAVIRSLSDVPAHGEGNELNFNEFLQKASENAAKILRAYCETSHTI
jgi:adenosylhomocysteine nucleosidase